MLSKNSYCNVTVIRKNLTRFAPLWVCYLLCLLTGLFVIYTDGSARPEYMGTAWQSFWYAQRLTRMFPVLSPVNLGYAFLTVQLLFGDLYNSRSCNMLHALPLRRETWFVSNCISGLLFSLIPTAVFTLGALALTLGSVVRSAWQIPLLNFAGANLQFITFFGMALFCAMAVGKRFTMAAAYALMNLGAIIAHWAITCVYTPMLYGVHLLEDWALDLTPVYKMALTSQFLNLDSAGMLRTRYGEDLSQAVVTFTLGEGWPNLMLWAAAGIVLAGAALVMYRCRHLERAGDAVAFLFLKPVFLVLCAIFVSTVVYGVPRAMIGERIPTFLLLALGLAAGWFVGKMLVEHTTQVFRLKNWYGLAALTAVMALTLVGTRFDVLNIEERRPDPEDIVSVSVDNYYGGGQHAFTAPEDIEKALRLHALALEDRPEPGTYVLENGQYVLFEEYPTNYEETKGQGPTEYTFANNLCISYSLKNGRKLVRRYVIWTQSEAGEIFRDMTSRWEYINASDAEVMTPEGEMVPVLDFVLAHFRSLSLEDYHSENFTQEDIRELLEAVKRDCAEGTMCRWNGFHTGYFHWPDKYQEDGYSQRTSVSLYLEAQIGNDYNYSAGWHIQIYPDSRHTLAWMDARGLLENVEIFHENPPLW